MSAALSRARGKANAPCGDGGDAALGLALRRFGNLAEYGAMALLVMLLLEMSCAAPRWLHAYGAALLAFRLLHPVVLFADPASPLWKKAGRVIAAAGTAALLTSGGIALLIGA
ncbi:MAG: MAPEG family protein [Pseudomonadota bacterium]